MPIKITKQERRNEQGDDLYIAEVTASNGTWRSPPLPSVELKSKLLRLGHNVLEIERAFQEVGVVHTPETTYSYVAKITRPFLQTALAGEREVPEQEPFAEAWLTYALFMHEGLHSLDEVIGSADAANHAIPNYDEVSWAFLHLRRRGWLVVEGDLYGLTPEGRRIIRKIVDRGEPPWPVRKVQYWIFLKTYWDVFPRGGPRPIENLEKWISANPLPGDE